MITKQNQEKNSSTPLISILMPVFNEEKYIEKCISSIINQDFTNWELIIVDDFSTDNTYNILGQCCLAEPRITLLQNEEKGIIPALRKAFKRASGAMITRMDGDDIMPVGKLRTLSKKLSALGEGNVVSGKVKYFSDGELGDGFRKYEQWINEQRYYEDIYKECTLPSACWMAYKSDLLDIEAFEVSQYPEDYDLLFRFYALGLKIIGLDQVLHLWRDHPARASRNDPNYLDQNFFTLKVHYFMKLDQDSELPLVVWGAGRKGKALMKEILQWRKLNEVKSKLIWISGNENKVGKDIYGIRVQHEEKLRSLKNKQVIMCISDTKFVAKKEEFYERFKLDDSEVFEFC